LNQRGLLFILLGLIAAVAAAAVVYSLSNGVAAKTSSVTVPTAVPQRGIDIVVARQDIAANTKIITDMLTLKQYPLDLLPSDGYTSTAPLVGTTTKVKVLQGDPLRRGQFIAAGGRIGASVNVEKGKVLVAFPSTDIRNSTGAVQPGDHVDILLTLPISGTARLDAGAGTESQLQSGKNLVSQATLQNIQVYSTGEWTPPNAQGGENARGLKIITFIVDHQEAIILKFVKDSGGVIDLVVRSLEEKDTVVTDPVNLDYLVDLYNSPYAARRTGWS
jgi:pilus assembly protein CpaB